MLQIISIVILVAIFAPQGVKNAYRTSGLSGDKISQNLNPVFANITDESKTHGKTVVAQEYEKHYQTEVQEYGASEPRTLSGYILPGLIQDTQAQKDIEKSLCAVLLYFTGKNCPVEGALSEEEKAAIIAREVAFEDSLQAEFGSWITEDLSLEQKRQIIKVACIVLEEYIIDCPRVSEAQCMTEGNCNSDAENPEPEATARDGLGGSHGAWQYRTRANLPGLSDSCRKELVCNPEERKAIWESIRCSHNFSCSTDQRNQLTLEKNKGSWDSRGKSDEDRLKNTREMVLKHNGAETPEAQASYLAPFNEYLVSLGGAPI